MACWTARSVVSPRSRISSARWTVLPSAAPPLRPGRRAAAGSAGPVAVASSGPGGSCGCPAAASTRPVAELPGSLVRSDFQQFLARGEELAAGPGRHSGGRGGRFGQAGGDGRRCRFAGGARLAERRQHAGQPHGVRVRPSVAWRVVVQGDHQVVGGAGHADVEEPELFLLVEDLLSVLCSGEACSAELVVQRDFWRAVRRPDHLPAGERRRVDPGERDDGELEPFRAVDGQDLRGVVVVVRGVMVSMASAAPSICSRAQRAPKPVNRPVTTSGTGWVSPPVHGPKTPPLRCFTAVRPRARAGTAMTSGRNWASGAAGTASRT